jgi:hypothetical protein
MIHTQALMLRGAVHDTAMYRALCIVVSFPARLRQSSPGALLHRGQDIPIALRICSSNSRFSFALISCSSLALIRSVTSCGGVECPRIPSAYGTEKSG